MFTMPEDTKLVIWATHPFKVTDKTVFETLVEWEHTLLHPLRYRLYELPPINIVSFDPSDRIEKQFKEAGVPLRVIVSRCQVPIREGHHNLFKIGGDLKTRTGLFTTTFRLRLDPQSDKDKQHIIKEARRPLHEDDVVFVIEGGFVRHEHPNDNTEHLLPRPYEAIFSRLTQGCKVVWKTNH